MTRKTAHEEVEHRKGARDRHRLVTGFSSIVFAHQRTPKVFDQNDISVVRVDGSDPKSVVATKAGRDRPGVLA